LEAERKQGAVEICVVDTGPGIPEKTRKELFRAFHSGSKAGGVGLGLAIAAEIVRAHGGKICLDTACPNTRFRFSIPDRIPA
ncbi:MAG: HAMP domain-containing histidine kinase, partial [Flavobacteriaceae bacterium]|nr:HAMP domain-containing histidine kinase [Flavobacteriaceae bacterium]